MAVDTRWEGSRAFMPAVRMVRAINRLPESEVRPEEIVIGRAASTMLTQAHVLTCPPEQLNAVSDDIFADLGEALEYAVAVRLPFEVTCFDFLDEHGEGPIIHVHNVEGGGAELGFELKAVVAAENPTEHETVYTPLIGARHQPPEEIGTAFVDWDGAPEPARWDRADARPRAPDHHVLGLRGHDSPR